MNPKSHNLLLWFFTALSGLIVTSADAEVDLNMVPITFPNNPPDTSVFPFNRGSVSYDYGMSEFETTNEQYAEFLNSKASLTYGANTLGLWADGMRGSPVGGILQSGSGTLADPYTYTTKPFMANKPVSFVSYFDALRFANWLTNGQGNGDTESGSYILTGGTAIPSNWLSIPRQAGGRYYLPTIDEWYKAAYYQPSSLGGDSDNYWAYPTASNVAPTQALPSTTGDVVNPGSNVAIIDGGFVWGGSNGRGNVGTVGSAGGHSFFGVYDMAGNVDEWTETRLNGSPDAALDAGGSYDFPQGQKEMSSNQSASETYTEQEGLGFRLVDLSIPEPTSTVLVTLGLVAGGGCHRRPRRAAVPREPR